MPPIRKILKVRNGKSLIIGFAIFSGISVFAQNASKSALPDSAKKRQLSSDTTQFKISDKPPVPPGGMEGYRKYLEKHIHYPQNAVYAGAQGTVYISMTVCKDGTLCDIHVEKDNAGHGCAEEAARAISEMPPWTPGTLNGTPVKVRYTVPVKFTFDADYELVYDVAPEPPGGSDSMATFLRENIKYPKKAIKDNIQGKVYVSFIVRRNGGISRVKVNKNPLGHGCGREAVRVVRKMKNWKPATLHGEPVEVRYEIPVEFKLNR